VRDDDELGLEDISEIKRVSRWMLGSSSGASTSSRMQKGLGWYLKTAISSASAVRAFSPPESSSTFLETLAGRRSDDVDAGVGRVGFVGEAHLAGAAVEEGREQLAENGR